MLRESIEPSSSSRACFPRASYIIMTVNVLLFASYADKLGTDSLSLDLEPGATVRDLLARVRELPGADRLPHEPLVAVNDQYAKSTQTIAPGDEVAIIPPVAGG